ncbi:MAG: GIY-YIG nuclease family protein [bacterium]|nr:GIY-YIG nuclease family protein [bacterium]
MYFVYMLRSDKDGSYYVGLTKNLRRRLLAHNQHAAQYTSTKAPFRLVWYCVFASRTKAAAFERYLKSGSGFAFARKRLV